MESNYGEFARLLFQTHYNNYTSPEEVKSKLYPLRDWVKGQIPQKLYRYRTFSDYSIEALKNDEIWGSSIATFNDPFECLPYYDLKKVNEYIDREFSVDIISQNFKDIASKNMPSKVLSAFPKELVEALSTGKMKIPTNDQLSEIMISIKAQVINYWRDNMTELEQLFFKEIVFNASMYHIACFSETNLDNLMWSHYAESHTGFCIEYDIKSMICNCSESCEDITRCSNLMLNFLIAPVIYSDNRYDASSNFMSMLLNWTTGKLQLPISNIYYDMLSSIKFMLVKSQEWKYEKEWRLFHNPDPKEFVPHKKIEKFKPSAVYMGARIEPNNKETLQRICKEKQIPCYPMVLQFFSSKFECIPLNNSQFMSPQDSVQTQHSASTGSPPVSAPV